MARREDWPERLNAYIAAIGRAEFQWGALDCCLFPANAIEQMTDDDPAAEYRGRYDDEGGARALLAEIGGGVPDMLAAIAAGNGWAEVKPSFSQRGDLLFLSDAIASRRNEFGGYAGLCLGPMAACFILDHGLALLPMRYATRAWHVV